MTEERCNICMRVAEIRTHESIPDPRDPTGPRQWVAICDTCIGRDVFRRTLWESIEAAAEEADRDRRRIQDEDSPCVRCVSLMPNETCPNCGLTLIPGAGRRRIR